MYKFKKRHGISSRKIGKKTSRSEEANKAIARIAKNEFLNYFERQRLRYHDGLIFNFDQSGFEYEMSGDRALSWTGERDTVVEDDTANKATHSYTIQPIISRDGRMFGRLLICLQEPENGKFGPRVDKQVRQLEKNYGNIYVVASESGKMSAALMRQWAEELLLWASRSPDLNMIENC